MGQEQYEAARTLGFEIRNPQRFAHNMARLSEEAGKAAAVFLHPHAINLTHFTLHDDLAPALKTLSQLQQAWLQQPHKVLEAQVVLWNNCLELWHSSMCRLMGLENGDVRPLAVSLPEDPRFQHPAWSENPYFDLLRQSYLITSHWAESLVDTAEDLEPRTRNKARFYLTQIINAIAPSNWVFTNPELLHETFASDGENLVRGMQLLAEDIERGSGHLKIRQTDTTKFEIGKNLAITPGKVIFRNELMELIQYAPTTEKVLKRPLLVVPPWINKFYILDLSPEKSFVKWAVDQGQTVFMISWVNPTKELAHKSFEDYMHDGILEALGAVEQATGERAIHALGYCVGGTLLAATLAYLAATRDTRVQSATFLTTQVDFSQAGDLRIFMDEEQVAAIERDMARHGYLDGHKMAAAFNLLRSNDLIWPYVVDVYLKGQTPLPLDLLYWNSDSTRIPAANHRFYLRRCYINNDLSQGRMKIGGVTLALSKVKIPIFHLAAREDHIAPARSVFLGARFLGGSVRFVVTGSGHIAGVVNPPTRNRYQYWTDGPPVGELETWLEAAEEHPGSWWPDWQAWSEAQDRRQVLAREIGGGKLTPIEDAPGSYVRVKS
ncbi:class I poly(R)-hydroxyalkanoic acid synthase (plasmid) [Microvirga ossetica]|uniref:Class I poly(R)-hydroxyalkanoic acid synthase n=1 Tax=Microvirga ossetica TaxID=1882682 RepID=A0A1B2EWE2_9HYPH|nr:class I poly(R)-hydroxyalkanoic acid synthase [Microvirga ossetica]ANY84270.1 class I poly(R)-hydroxyalkanoic acid synthase [Microvirga ossetica]